MKCNQPRPGFELVSPCPFPTTITITPRIVGGQELLLRCWNEGTTISFVYKNINSVIRNVVMVVCMGKRVGGLLWLTPHRDRHRDQLLQASLTIALIQSGFSARGPPPDWRVYLLTVLGMTALILCHYQFFWSPPTFFPSSAIHLIHFRCHLFTVRHSRNILFTKSTINGCQSLICNTCCVIIWTPENAPV